MRDRPETRRTGPAHTMPRWVLPVLLAMLVAPLPVEGAKLTASKSGRSTRTFANAPAATPPKLLSAATRRETLLIAKTPSRSTFRRRAARVNPAALRGTKASATLELALFPDTTITAEKILVADRNGAKDYSWFGRIPGEDAGQVILTVVNGDLSGTILSGGRLFRIQPTKTHAYEISEVDTAAGTSEECGEGMGETRRSTRGLERHPTNHVREATKKGDRGFRRRTEANYVRLAEAWRPYTYEDNGRIAVVRVGALYTQAAAKLTQNMALDFQSALDRANAAFILSEVYIHLQSAGLQQVNYTESGDLPTDLDLVGGFTTTWTNEAHTLRNQWNADIMSLIVADGNWNGYAKTIDKAGNAGAHELAYNVVKYWPFANAFTFAHEVGHNLGARHDRYTYAKEGSQPNALSNRGVVLLDHRVRTIMAYNDECEDADVDCQIIPFFSNHEITYATTPLGVAPGAPDSADNRLQMNVNRGHVENFH